MTTQFWHTLNGKRFTTEGLPTPPESEQEYRQMIRKAYGSLKGVKTGIIPVGRPHPNF